MNALEHQQSLRDESDRLHSMNAAWNRMASAALSKDATAFDRARAEFWDCAPQREKVA